MSEVAKVGKPDLAIGERTQRVSSIETGAGSSVMAITHEGEADETGRYGRDAGRQHQISPLGAPQKPQKVGGSRSERQGAHEDTARHSSALSEPRRHDFHAWRVDTRQGHAGQEPEYQGNPDALGHDCDQAVEGGPEEGADSEQMSCVSHVGQVEEGAQKRPCDEPGLYRHGQPGSPRRGELPLGGDRIHDRRGGKPEGHAETFGDGDPREHAPFHR